MCRQTIIRRTVSVFSQIYVARWNTYAQRHNFLLKYIANYTDNRTYIYKISHLRSSVMIEQIYKDGLVKAVIIEFQIC